MKKFLMIFGLALVTGVGVFALTESMASEDFMTNLIPHVGCGCETCGETCDCAESKTCGDEFCSCGEAVAASCDGNCDGNCSVAGECGSADCGCSKTAGAGSCAGGASCSASGGASSCDAAKTFSGEEKSAGCGCGKH